MTTAMQETSTKPYLLRALHEWCTDNGYTPHIVVQVDENTQVPRAYIRDGQITLNVGTLATHNLRIDNDWISFQARFNGVTEDIWVPVAVVTAIYARETGAGMGFEVQEYETGRGDAAAEGSKAPANAAPAAEKPANEPSPAGGKRRSHLSVVK